MSQKHPVSVITDGDLAMQSAIRSIFPSSNHRLCTWHIERNMIQNLHNSKIVEEFKKFLYDCCTIPEIERKWVDFLERNQVSDESCWVYQMYQMRRLWCAAYQVGKRFLGLKSNQRSESLNSKLHTHLDSRMTLFDLLQHYEHCLSNLRRNEALLDSIAIHSTKFTESNAWNVEKDVVTVFTPTIFVLVKQKIDSISNYVISEILDGFKMTTYVISVREKRERKFHIDCEFTESSLAGIRCSCRNVECDGMPCGHIFYVLNIMHAGKIPRCCVDRRWTMGAKSAFPPIRKSGMYNHSQSLERYRNLRNLSHAACLKSSQTDASYAHMKHFLSGIVGTSDEANANKKNLWYDPVLPQTVQDETHSPNKVLDPLQVQSRGVPKKKRMKGFLDKPKKRIRTCKVCKKTGHDRRTCSKRKELESHIEVEENSAFKEKAISEEEEDYVDDYGSESSTPGSLDYFESRESSTHNDSDGDDAIGGDEYGDITTHGGIGPVVNGSNGATGDVGETSYLRPRSTRTRRRPTNLESVYQL